MAGPTNEDDFLRALQTVGTKEPALLQTDDEQLAAPLETGSRDKPVGTTAVSTPPATVTAENFWRHPDAHPIVIDLALLRKYGPEWMGWEGETLRFLIPRDFHTQTVSELTIAKLQACKVLHLVDSFWESWEIFSACLMPFNNEFPNFQVMPVPTVAQCLVACDVATRIRDDVPWSTELKAYVSTVYQHEGIFLPLPPADFVSLDVPEEIDVAALARKWPEVRAKGSPPKGETPLDEQLRRLLLVNDFLEESRAQLHRQLELHV